MLMQLLLDYRKKCRGRKLLLYILLMYFSVWFGSCSCFVGKQFFKRGEEMQLKLKCLNGNGMDLCKKAKFGAGSLCNSTDLLSNKLLRCWWCHFNSFWLSDKTLIKLLEKCVLKRRAGLQKTAAPPHSSLMYYLQYFRLHLTGSFRITNLKKY